MALAASVSDQFIPDSACNLQIRFLGLDIHTDKDMGGTSESFI